MDRPLTSEAVVMQRHVVHHRQAAATGSICQLVSSQNRRPPPPAPPPQDRAQGPQPFHCNSICNRRKNCLRRCGLFGQVAAPPARGTVPGPQMVRYAVTHLTPAAPAPRDLHSHQCQPYATYRGAFHNTTVIEVDHAYEAQWTQSAESGCGVESYKAWVMGPTYDRQQGELEQSPPIDRKRF